MFKKVIELKNKGAKASAVISLIGGAFAYVAGSAEGMPFPWILQGIGVVLFTYSIYIATAYLFKRHALEIIPVHGEGNNGEVEYDLVIYETAGTRERKVCDVPVSNVDFIRVVDKKNKKTVANDRKNKDRYTYDAQFASQRRIEIAITSGDEVASILLTYDDDVLSALTSVGVERKN